MSKNLTPMRLLINLLLLVVAPLFTFAQPPMISYESKITGLSVPVDIVNAGDGSNRLFIVEQSGTIKVWNGTTVSVFGNFGASGADLISYSPGGERGLLSLAFHPNFDGVTNRYFFIYYTNAAGNIEVRRFQTTLGNSNTADLDSGTPIITILHPTNANHNGGKLNFGPDGNLYFCTGDGGGGNDVPNNAQSGTSLLGKMIRINIDIPSATYGNYSIPVPDPTDPGSDPLADPRIYNFGLRNPFRWSFDRLNGNMWIGDVGQGAQEEINFRPAALKAYNNFGWHCYEGYIPTPGVTPCTIPGAVPPVYDYPNPASGSSAVTGGYVYRGTEYPNFRGYYIATDVYSGDIHILWPNGSGGFDSSVQLLSVLTINFVVGFGEAEDGTLYAVSQGTGIAYKVVATGGAVLPTKLGNFTATPANGYNRVQWKTLAETNTRRFHVEYGTDGRSFDRVATVLSKGYTNGSEYSFDHFIRSNKDIYYRLVMEDFSGAIQYSQVVRVPGNGENGIRIYPTVVNGNTFTLESLYQPVNSIRIMNASGAVIYKKEFSNFTGTIPVSLPVMAKGVYVVEITGKGVLENEKIIIQ